MVHPKGSWVPHKPFPSQKILGNLVGDQSLHKVMFLGTFLGPKRGLKKYNFVKGLVPHEVSQDFLREEWFVWHAGTLWLCPFPSKTLPGDVFYRDFPQTQKSKAGIQAQAPRSQARACQGPESHA